MYNSLKSGSKNATVTRPKALVAIYRVIVNGPTCAIPATNAANATAGSGVALTPNLTLGSENTSERSHNQQSQSRQTMTIKIIRLSAGTNHTNNNPHKGLENPAKLTPFSLYCYVNALEKTIGAVNPDHVINVSNAHGGGY